jgi:chromosome segregation ATPase
VSERTLYVPTVPSEHGNRTEMELGLIAESASIRARLAETERERADCVRVSDVARALGVLEDIDTGRDIIEAAQSIKQDADRWSDEAIGLRARLAEAERGREAAISDYMTLMRERNDLLTQLEGEQIDLAQAREELAALRKVSHRLAAESTEAKRAAWKACRERDLARHGLRKLLDALCVPHVDAALSKLSALPGAIESACSGATDVDELERDESTHWHCRTGYKPRCL